MQLDPKEIEEMARALYIRALKMLPRDIKQGFERLIRSETDATGRAILGTMVENIAVAEKRQNLLCQDTGIPIYNVVIGKNVEFDGTAMKEAIRPLNGTADWTFSRCISAFSRYHPIRAINWSIALAEAGGQRHVRPAVAPADPARAFREAAGSPRADAGGRRPS
jgi:hypothetical protein